MTTTTAYRFLRHERDLMRMNERMQTDVWQGNGGRRSPYQLDVFNDSYSFIPAELAQQLERDADLYAPAVLPPPGAPVPGSGAHVRARLAAAS
jgi:hypothetical protein